MDFVTTLLISTNWKKEAYNSILVIVDWLINMVYYKQLKITIYALKLVKIIMEMVVKHHGLLDLIISHKSFLFSLKFWLLLRYLFYIKCKLSRSFHLKTNKQTEWQNSTIEFYLWLLMNFVQNNWAMLLRMTEFAYNNAMNKSTSHMFFELNYGYHSWVYYKKDINSYSKSKIVKNLSFESRELITICWKISTMLKNFK